jgi:hypothetical protein
MGVHRSGSNACCGCISCSTDGACQEVLLNSKALFAKVGEVFQAQGLKLGTGTIISASSSTKNADKQRDPEIHQTR